MVPGLDSVANEAEEKKAMHGDQPAFPRVWRWHLEIWFDNGVWWQLGVAIRVVSSDR